jgi:pimeloyl-ACP methyl ester carboxylesterase
MGQVVLVHGAWHGAWCWAGVVDELGRRGVTATAVELPFTGFADDVAEVRSAIASGGPAVVVCAHSYGGVVVNQAVDPGQVGHIVYLAALVNIADSALVLNATSSLADAMVTDGPQCTFDPLCAPHLFYGDSDPQVPMAAAARLRPMVMQAEAFFDSEPRPMQIPSTYVVCTRDRAITPEGQHAMARASGAVVEWPTDHSPFLTRPGEVAELLTRLARPD